MPESKPLAEAIAREHFYCPGPWNEQAFVRDYALFIILRKQCIRYLKTGQLNHRLALNNAIIALNSFGKTAVNRIIKTLFDKDQSPVAASILSHLSAMDVDHFTKMDSTVLKIIADDGVRFNLGH